MIKSNNYYQFLLEKDGRRYEVQGRLLKIEDTIYEGIKTYWIQLPFSVARALSNANVVRVSEPKGSIMG